MSGCAIIILTLAMAPLMAACETDMEEDTFLDEDSPDATDVPLERVTEMYPAVTSDAGVTEKGCTIPRSDVAAYITIGSGSWGSWQQCYEFCPADTFAYAVILRSEPGQGGGDDTAMNGIAIACYNRWNGAYQGYVTSHAGYWGDWVEWAFVNPANTGNPFVSGRMKIESPQGIGDDTAANIAQLKCMNGVWIQPDAHTSWGSWNSETACPSGTAICGVKTRVESQQGGGDDTALNGTAFACCSF